MLIRILEVLASPGWGGAERVFVELVEGLSVDPDIEVQALVHPDAAYTNMLRSSGIEVRRLYRGSRRNPFAIRDLRRQIREVRPDIVHSHQAKATELVFWANRRTGSIQAATTHNARRRAIYRRVRHVSAVSKLVANGLNHPRGAEVIPNGVVTRSIEPRPRPDRFTVVAVGRLDSYKGFDRLIWAVSRLRGVNLIIAGEGSEREALERLIAGLGVTEAVILLGHRDDIPEILASSHLQVVSSTTEGFSLALLEGLHYAPALLSTPVGIAPEVLPDEFLIQDASAETIAAGIERIQSDYEGAVARFAKAAAPARAAYSPEAMLAGYRSWFDRILTEV